MDIILTIPIHNALAYTYTHYFTKTSNECKLISLEFFFFGRGWFGGDALDTDM